jgi:excisionase family DNA binding protein
MSHRPAGVAPAEVGSKGGRTPIKTLSPSQSRPVPRRGLSRAEAAMYLGISPSKFDELVKDGRMPRPRVIDCRKVWDVYELDMAFDELPREDGPSTAGSSWDDR